MLLMLCKIAHRILDRIKWIWLIPISTILATYIANIAPTSAKDFANGFPGSIFGWLILGPFRIYIYIGIGFLIVLPIAAWIVTRRCSDDEQEIKEHNSLNTYVGNMGIVQQHGNDGTVLGPKSTYISRSIVYFGNTADAVETNLKSVENVVTERDGNATNQENQKDSTTRQNQVKQDNSATVNPDKDVGLSTDGNPVQSNVKLASLLPAFNPSWLKNLDPPGGSVRLKSPFYIERQIDMDAKEVLLREGETLRIKGSQQVGKTSLLARLYQQAQGNSYPALYISFDGIDNNDLKDLEILLLWLANKIANSQKTNSSPSTYWRGPLGSKDKLTEFLSREVLANAAKPFVLIMDKVDRVFVFEKYRDDFFSLIRSWHNARAFDSIWDKFNVVLAYSTEAFLFIENLDQSPFNVGTEVKITDFNRTQVEELNRRHGKPVKTTQEMDAMMELLGGHPFLVRKSLYDLIVIQLAVKDLIEKACDEDGPFSNHLHSYLWHLNEQPDLHEAMKSVIYNHSCSTDILFYRLASSGLVLGSDRHNVQPRCGLYAQYFRKHL